MAVVRGGRSPAFVLCLGGLDEAESSARGLTSIRHADARVGNDPGVCVSGYHHLKSPVRVEIGAPGVIATLRTGFGARLYPSLTRRRHDRAMLPIRHQSIFKSRWIALLWAAGIIWSAVEFTGGLSGGHADDNQATSDNAGQPDNGDAAAAALQGAVKTLQGL